jgi:D-alanyl-lipoteichoic acid acyltransferase DltB (MBOAT superfamily)
MVYAGMWLVMAGLFKKAILADYISQYNDLIFAAPNHYNGFENLMAVYGYTLQIYLDFSGYSDMAIGLAKMLGYDLDINFRLPYQSMNITEFWRRWHISLSTWLRDYVYIPLGGNRRGKVKQYRNLMLTMLIGGLWHGANWKFVFWGGMHGIALAIHKFVQKFTDKIKSSFLSRFSSWFITFHFVIFLWIFFRATDIIESRTVTVVQDGVKTEAIQNVKVDAFVVSWTMIKQIFTNLDLSFAPKFWEARYLWVILVVIGFGIHFIPLKVLDELPNKFAKIPFVLKLVIFIVLVQLVIQFKNTDVQPFIYFQF